MSIIFKKLSYKNFLSTGNVKIEIDLCSHKNTLIVGNNGAGKSTMLDALSFCLFNRSYRKINKPQLINSINNKHMVCEVAFDIGKKSYLVRRGLKPTIFEIYCNDKLVSQDARIVDYQSYFEQHILKLNHKSFSQIVVLGSTNFTPFMQLTTQHRREIIEDILDIQIFTVMNGLLKDRIAQNKIDLISTQASIDKTKSLIDLHLAHLKKIKSSNSDNIKQLQKQVAEYAVANKKLDETNRSTKTEIDRLQQSIVKRKNDSKKLNEYNQLKIQILNNRRQHDKEVKFFNSHDECPTCTQLIDTQFKQSAIASRSTMINQIDQALEKLDANVAQLNNRIEQTKIVTDKIAKLDGFISNNNSIIKTNDKLIEQLQQQQQLLKQTIKKTVDDKQLEDYNKQVAELTEQKIQLTSDREALAICGHLLKDGGIKAKIIKQYIPIINKLINKYLTAMDFFIDFSIDENFEETIKSRFRDKFVYENFSEGEKSRIDLALLFAWRSIARMRNSVSTNLLIFDEIFDGSLDNNGTEEFMKILATVTTGTNAFIITHKGDQMADKFNHVLRFEKHHNFTRLA